MGKNVFNKGMALALILLFFGVGFASSDFLKTEDILKNSTISSISEKTIYVDDNNIQGPWDGSINFPYQYIQDGIDNASIGDTVFVFNGTYNENILIGLSINLIGENRDTTIIKGIDIEDVIFVFSNNVNINGFTVKGAIFACGITLFKSNNSCISNNLIIDNGYGVNLNNFCENFLIENDVFSNSEDTIIYSNNNIITDNILTGNSRYGIFVYASKNNIIENNSLLDSDISGIRLQGSLNNIVYRNKVIDNYYGIICCCGATNNTIYYNIFKNNYNGNAVDVYTNQWDNGAVGNFWDDYNGVDNNSDGIGDIPYAIPGGNNKDYFPLIKPWENNPPNTPTINGPTTGTAGVTYYYNISTVDPDGDDVYYWIQWFEGCPGVNWQGPFPSDTIIQFNHSWVNQGTYLVKVNAKDIYGDESDTATLTVTMPRNKIKNKLSIQFFINFLEDHHNLILFLKKFEKKHI